MSARSRVLAIFRKLHRTRLQVFEGDEVSLTAGRNKINEEFRKNKDEQDAEAIKKLVKTAEASEEILRKTIVQAKLQESGVYAIKMTKDTKLEKNTPYKHKKDPFCDNANKST